MTRLAFTLALASVGCGIQLEVDPSKVVPPPLGATEAIQAVADSYGLRSLPAVFWYGGAALDCMDGHGYHDQVGACVAGEQLGGVITVAAPEGMAISSLVDERGCAVLAHEVAHAASEQAGQDGCGNHDCRWFKGPCQYATARLAGLGL